MKEGEEIKQKTHIPITHKHRQQTGDNQGERRWGRWSWAKRR